MSEATLGQVVELLYKRSREEMQLLGRIASGEITREELQQMITESERSPKERLARALVKKAESAIDGQFEVSSAPADVFAEICAVYELLGESNIADKIMYRTGSSSLVYLERIKALCEKNDLERARKVVVQSLSPHLQQFAWIAIADKSQEESDYARINIMKMARMDFDVRLGIAQSRAKTDSGAMLQSMRNETEIRMGNEYWRIIAALAKEYIRQGFFSQARTFIQQLVGMLKVGSYPYMQLDVILTLAQASRVPHDIAMYRELGIKAYEKKGSEKRRSEYIACLAHVAALTGQEEDFTACREAIEDDPGLYPQSLGYSALALAYAQCGNIPTAREIADNKIPSSREEAKTLARMARIVLSQDSQ